MFENMLRAVRELEQGIRIPVQLPLDNDGYFDRRCPSEACQADFKILWEDWKGKVSDAQVFCPLCREEAKSTEWNTPEQAEYLGQIGIRYTQDVIDQALSQDAGAFN